MYVPACADAQREASKQQGVAQATKQELSNRMSALMQELEVNKQQQRVRIWPACFAAP